MSVSERPSVSVDTLNAIAEASLNGCSPAPPRPASSYGSVAVICGSSATGG
jgi:hypothetical protein